MISEQAKKKAEEQCEKPNEAFEELQFARRYWICPRCAASLGVVDGGQVYMIRCGPCGRVWPL